MAKKKFGLGIILGAVAGVIAGFLTAPKSGKETRQDLKDKAKEVKGSAERKLKNAHRELGVISDDARLKAKELQGKAKDEMDEVALKAEALKARVKTAITSIKSGDDEDDDATIDKLMEDLTALKDKIARKAKNITK